MSKLLCQVCLVVEIVLIPNLACAWTGEIINNGNSLYAIIGICGAFVMSGFILFYNEERVSSYFKWVLKNREDIGIITRVVSPIGDLLLSMFKSMSRKALGISLSMMMIFNVFSIGNIQSKYGLSLGAREVFAGEKAVQYKSILDITILYGNKNLENKVKPEDIVVLEYQKNLERAMSSYSFPKGVILKVNQRSPSEVVVLVRWQKDKKNRKVYIRKVGLGIQLDDNPAFIDYDKVDNSIKQYKKKGKIYSLQEASRICSEHAPMAYYRCLEELAGKAKKTPSRRTRQNQTPSTNEQITTAITNSGDESGLKNMPEVDKNALEVATNILRQLGFEDIAILLENMNAKGLVRAPPVGGVFSEIADKEHGINFELNNNYWILVFDKDLEQIILTLIHEAVEVYYRINHSDKDLNEIHQIAEEVENSVVSYLKHVQNYVDAVKLYFLSKARLSLIIKFIFLIFGFIVFSSTPAFAANGVILSASNVFLIAGLLIITTIGLTLFFACKILSKKHSVKMLRARIEQIDALLKGLSYAVFVIDPNNKIILQTDSKGLNGFLLTFGYAQGDIEGIDIDSLVAEESTAQLKEHIEKLNKKGKAEDEIKFKVLNGDNRLCWVVSERIKLFGGEYTFSIVRDITKEAEFTAKFQELKDKMSELDSILKSQQNLIHLGKMMAQFFHDLRNMLQPIISGIELLILEIDDDDILKKIQPIKKALDNILRMSDMARKIGGGDADRRILLNLKDLIVSIEGFIDLWNKKYTIDIELDIEKGIEQISIEAFFGQIELVMSNLIKNAIEELVSSNKKDSKILIKIYEVGTNLEICVFDNGDGVDQRIVEKWVQPGYSTKGINGTGMGVSHAKKTIEEKHFGEFRIYSWPGVGTVFCISLPLPKQIIKIKNKHRTLKGMSYDLQQVASFVAEVDTFIAMVEKRNFLNNVSKLINQIITDLSKTINNYNNEIPLFDKSLLIQEKIVGLESLNDVIDELSINTLNLIGYYKKCIEVLRRIRMLIELQQFLSGEEYKELIDACIRLELLLYNVISRVDEEEVVDLK